MRMPIMNGNPLIQNGTRIYGKMKQIHLSLKEEAIATKKARQYAAAYFIEQNKKRYPKWTPTKEYQKELKRFIDGIITANEFIEKNKVENL